MHGFSKAYCEIVFVVSLSLQLNFLLQKKLLTKVKPKVATNMQVRKNVRSQAQSCHYPQFSNEEFAIGS